MELFELLDLDADEEVAEVDIDDMTGYFNRLGSRAQRTFQFTKLPM